MVVFLEKYCLINDLNIKNEKIQLFQNNENCTIKQSRRIEQRSLCKTDCVRLNKDLLQQEVYSEMCARWCFEGRVHGSTQPATRTECSFTSVQIRAKSLKGTIESDGKSFTLKEKRLGLRQTQYSCLSPCSLN